MDFDKPKVYGDTFISDGLVIYIYIYNLPRWWIMYIMWIIYNIFIIFPDGG